MAELADVLDLGSSAARRGGSSPFTRLLEYAGLAQLVEHLICNQRVEGSHLLAGAFRGRSSLVDLLICNYSVEVSFPLVGIQECGSSSVGEHHLAKVGVAGSNPVFRFFLF